jgi:hypothetical protein
MTILPIEKSKYYNNSDDAPSFGTDFSDLGLNPPTTQVERLNRSRSLSPDGKPPARGV